MKYDILLIDADETLMDFPAAEHQALIRTFQAHNLPFSDEIDQLYQSINQNLWREFEQNKITCQQLLTTRFAKLFEALHIDLDSDAFNTEYLFNLGFGDKTLPHALDTCKQLHKMGCRLYILTNGVGATQRRRIQASGLSPFLTDIFVSEESGFQKPMKEFFDYVFARIPDFDKTRALMIGDSLAMKKRRAMWRYLEQKDPALYRRMRLSVGGFTYLPSKLGNRLSLAGYRLAKKVVKFQ